MTSTEFCQSFGFTFTSVSDCNNDKSMIYIYSMVMIRSNSPPFDFKVQTEASHHQSLLRKSCARTAALESRSLSVNSQRGSALPRISTIGDNYVCLSYNR